MIHVMIAEERRLEDRGPPQQVGAERRAKGQGRAATVRKNNGVPTTQIHTMGEYIADVNDPQILYALEWDQRSPWGTWLKGTVADIQLAYMGWPMIDYDTWVAQNP